MALHDEQADLHARLLRLVKSAGVEVEGRSNRLPGVDWHGTYCPAREYPHRIPGYPTHAPPRIELARDRAHEVDDYLDELVTLAHEYGHHLSAQRGLRPEAYETAVNEKPSEWPTVLNDDQRRAVFDEERRAWLFAREVLSDLHFAAWEAFQRREADGLAEYRTRLPLPE